MLHRQRLIPLSGYTSKITNLVSLRKISETSHVKSKTFLQINEAPDSVKYREFAPPDEPSNPLGLSVAVVGRPNAGKSTILNRLVNSKVSAVSPKYNTTRRHCLGIRTSGRVQTVFSDTPGFVDLEDRHKFVRSLVADTTASVHGVDVTMMVIDSVKRLYSNDKDALSSLMLHSFHAETPLMFVLNKIDLLTDRKKLTFLEGELTEIMQDTIQKHTTEAGKPLDNYRVGDPFYHVSAKMNKNMKVLEKGLEKLAVARPWSFHSSVVTMESDLDLVHEIIREKIYRRVNQDLPYAIQQENRGWTEMKDGSLRIDQDILVPRKSQLKILIGRNGDNIRAIGTSARIDLSKLLEKEVHLYLKVRVQKKPEYIVE